MEVFRAAACLIVKSVVLSAQWAGQRRLLCLQRAAASEGELAQLRAELVVVRDENQRLNAENALLKGCLGGRARKQRYTPMQRLQILWHMAYYGIPRKRVKEHFCIAKSTLYRWLHAAQDGVLGADKAARESPRKTPAELAQVIWDIFESNPHFGRHRIAMTLWTLRVFVAASTVRNILLRPKPARTTPSAAVHKQQQKPRHIVARYPNHVWSVGRTRVWLAHLAHLDAGGSGSLLPDGYHDLPT